MHPYSLRRVIFALALSVLWTLGGCGGGADTSAANNTGGEGAQGGGGATGGTGEGAGGGTGGEGAQGGTGGGGTGGDICAPQDAEGVGDCKVLLGVKWNGEACVDVGGCECVGEDCDELYDTVEGCKAAHQECIELGPCDPQQAKGVGDCDAFFGYAWNGQQCVGISGCSCEGASCDMLYDTVDACTAAHADCGPPLPDACAPQKAEGDGPCAVIIGYKWDGMTCVAMSGCSCIGEDCDKIYDTGEACMAAHETCLICLPQKAMGVGGCELLLGYLWNGMECVPLSGCSCEGPDCANLYDSPDACAAEHAVCP